MSQTRFYELGQLLGAYFHQDWTLMNSDATVVIRSIVEENPRAELRRAAVEIDELLGLRLSEDELARLFYPELGIYYVPPADGLSYSDWLQSVRNAFLVEEKGSE